MYRKNLGWYPRDISSALLNIKINLLICTRIYTALAGAKRKNANDLTQTISIDTRS